MVEVVREARLGALGRTVKEVEVEVAVVEVVVGVAAVARRNPSDSLFLEILTHICIYEIPDDEKSIDSCIQVFIVNIMY